MKIIVAFLSDEHLEEGASLILPGWLWSVIDLNWMNVILLSTVIRQTTCRVTDGFFNTEAFPIFQSLQLRRWSRNKDWLWISYSTIFSHARDTFCKRQQLTVLTLKYLRIDEPHRTGLKRVRIIVMFQGSTKLRSYSLPHPSLSCLLPLNTLYNVITGWL